MLYKLIHDTRIAQGLSISELARKSHHPITTIHGIDTGRNKKPSFAIICDLLSVLEIPIETAYSTYLKSKNITP